MNQWMDHIFSKITTFFFFFWCVACCAFLILAALSISADGFCVLFHAKFLSHLPKEIPCCGGLIEFLEYLFLTM
jgi:hypothetical protein